MAAAAALLDLFKTMVANIEKVNPNIVDNYNIDHYHRCEIRIAAGIETSRLCSRTY
jgi:hypothetical protein